MKFQLDILSNLLGADAGVKLWKFSNEPSVAPCRWGRRQSL